MFVSGTLCKSFMHAFQDTVCYGLVDPSAEFLKRNRQTDGRTHDIAIP